MNGNIPIISGSEPSAEEIMEAQIVSMKAQLAHRLAIEATINNDEQRLTADLNNADGIKGVAKDVADYAVTLADLLVEAYRPKLPKGRLN